MPEINQSEWMEFLGQHPETHLLQSAEWGDLKSAFGWEAVRVVEGNAGAQILFRRLPLGFTFAYLPKGPVADTAPEPGFWEDVERSCRKRRAVFLKIEADGWMENQPIPAQDASLFVSSPQHIQPHSTLVVDLQGTQ